MISKGKVPAFLCTYRKFECLHLFDGVDENNFVVNSMTISTDETMADLVESAIVPHIVKYGGPDGKQRALFILDGACSHRVESDLFTAAALVITSRLQSFQLLVLMKFN